MKIAGCERIFEDMVNGAKVDRIGLTMTAVMNVPHLGLPSRDIEHRAYVQYERHYGTRNGHCHPLCHPHGRHTTTSSRVDSRC